jgi:hypothetical protein
VIRASKYLAEKYPGLVTLFAGDNNHLGFHIANCSHTRAHFIARMRDSLPHEVGSFESIEGEDVTLVLFDHNPDFFNAIYTYVAALAERYQGVPLPLETHMPVIEVLVGRRQEWGVQQPPVMGDIRGKSPFALAKHMKDIGIEWGWGNGYVGVCKDHPWYQEGYDEIDVEAHGGLTYADKAFPKGEESEEDGLWWVGFDTGHYSDTLEKWPKEAVEGEAKWIFLQAAWAFAEIDNPMHRS